MVQGNDDRQFPITEAKLKLNKKLQFRAICFFRF